MTRRVLTGSIASNRARSISRRRTQYRLARAFVRRPPNVCGCARWTTASALRTASRHAPLASDRSPTIAVAPWAVSEAASFSDRVSASTSWPAAIAARRKYAPMKPVAPVTKILCPGSAANLATSTHRAERTQPSLITYYGDVMPAFLPPGRQYSACCQDSLIRRRSGTPSPLGELPTVTPKPVETSEEHARDAAL